MNEEDKNSNSPTVANNPRDLNSSNSGANSNNKLERNNFQANSELDPQDSIKTQQLDQNSQDSSNNLMNYEDHHKLNLTQDDEEGDDNHEDDDYEDDERFIRKDSHLQEVNEEIMQDIISDLDEYSQSLESIRPNTSHNRSLSHEHGGVEKKTITHDKGGESLEEDEWDKQTEEVAQDFKEEDERLNDIDESSLRQSFIHTSKQKKKKRRKGRRGKSEPEGMEEEPTRRLGLLEARSDNKASFVDRMNSRNSSNSRGGGGGIQII